MFSFNVYAVSPMKAASVLLIAVSPTRGVGLAHSRGLVMKLLNEPINGKVQSSRSFEVRQA